MLHTGVSGHRRLPGDKGTSSRHGLALAILTALLFLPIALLLDSPSALASIPLPARPGILPGAPGNVCPGAVYTVTTTLDDGSSGTLRAALANPCPIINFALANPSTIVVTGTESVNFGKTINGPGQSALFIDGNSSFRIFDVAAVTLNVNNLTIQNGQCACDGAGMNIQTGAATVMITNVAFLTSSATSGAYGGAIRVNDPGSTLVISGTTFRANSAPGHWGGAIDHDDGTLVITNTAFLNNSAGSGGGAIDTDGGSITISGSTFMTNTGPSGGALAIGGAVAIANSSFANNSGTIGGAIYAITGTVSVRGTTFTYNNSSNYGGAVWSGVNTTIATSSLLSNTATNGGPAVYLFSTAATSSILSSTIAYNNVLGPGGVAATDGIVFNAGSGNLTIANTTIANNVGPASCCMYGLAIENTGSLTVTNSAIYNHVGNYQGGGIWNNGTLVMANSTLFNNTAAVTGGGLHNGYNGTGGTVSILNSTVYSNSASTGGGVYNDSGTTMTFANTIIGNAASGGNCNVHSGSIVDGGNNLDDGTSCGFGGATGTNTNPRLGSLASNGGATQTLALVRGSPAIDAGSDATCAAAPVSGVDQRGVHRPIGSHCDIGAFEAFANIFLPLIVR